VGLVLWVSQLLPLAATGLVAVLLPAMVGILASKDVYALFGNQSVFFILGAFILAAAVMKSGLSTRLTLVLLSQAGGGADRLVTHLFFVALFFSFWIPEHAVAIMLFPIVLEITQALKLRPGHSRFGASLFWRWHGAPSSVGSPRFWAGPGHRSRLPFSSLRQDKASDFLNG